MRRFSNNQRESEVGKKVPPSTRRTAADGGVGHRTEKALCPRDRLAQVKLGMEQKKETPTDQGR
jgi:hypothetical protein